MNIKSSIATFVLVASVGAVSACESTAKTASPAPQTPAPATSATAPATAPGAPTATATTAPGGAKGSSGPRLDVPDSVLLAVADLAPAPSGTWKTTGGRPTQKGTEILDPDGCDPTPRPQSVDPAYPRNPAWGDLRAAAYAGAANSQADEAVLTYTSAAAAAADFAKHQGWVANCSDHFQWTDAPQKFLVTPVTLSGVSGAYAYQVRMRGTDQSLAVAGNQGYAYVAVILRGNSITFLDIAQTAIDGPTPKDPGTGGLQHDVKVLAPKLAAVYGASV